MRYIRIIIFNVNIQKVQTITFELMGINQQPIQRNVIYSYHHLIAIFRKYEQ